MTHAQPCEKPTLVYRRLIILAGLAAVSACAKKDASTSLQDQTLRTGVIYTLPGVSGGGLFYGRLVKVLKETTDREVVMYDWTNRTGLLGWHSNLTNIERNREEASKLARAILSFKDAHPDLPVSIVAHSGGGGIAVMAAEQLPRSARIDSIVLLAPAVSPDYDLNDALAGTKRGIWNFYSRGDFMILVVGTKLFGTMDREQAPSAGAIGFRLPANASIATTSIYDTKLKQISYDGSMRSDGYFGGHIGWTRRSIVKKWIAPIICGAAGPADRIARSGPIESKEGRVPSN